MKNNLEEIDQLIKETLTEQETKFYDSLEEQNAFQMLWGIFSGKNKWLMILTSIIQAAFFGLFIYCLVEFLHTDETNELIRWGLAGVVCIMASSMLKLYAWMQVERKTIIREIKRIELLLSSMSSKIS
ncbi:DUF6768 family protein [Pseudotenacibaculum haliotis]|uniref:DUF6768 family protein n=1 Tax=Pseudotenacibaculum haliotis TaxID=1862138 RepID=A0ABW5LSU9_9FLAO